MAELGVHAGGFVDVAAEEAGWLHSIDEGADGGRTEVQAFAGAVERRVLGGAMAYQYQRAQVGKWGQARRDLGLGVLAGGVEGREVGIAEGGQMIRRE